MRQRSSPLLRMWPPPDALRCWTATAWTGPLWRPAWTACWSDWARAGRRSFRCVPPGRDPEADLDATPFRAALAQLSVPGVTISALNLKEEADALYGEYLHSAIRLCCAGLAAIALLLCVALHSFTRAGLVLLPLGLAALSVASGFALSHRPMNLLHLIGLLLIFAVGSNYALFFDRGAIQKGRPSPHGH